MVNIFGVVFILGLLVAIHYMGHIAEVILNLQGVQ
jgi:hypothetical protein